MSVHFVVQVFISLDAYCGVMAFIPVEKF